MKLAASDIARLCNGELIGSDTEISGISVDTRTLVKGDAFVCLQAEHDGNKFVPQAIEKGAVCIISDKRLSCEIAVVMVKNTLILLGTIAAYIKARLSPYTIAVTGSVGKTGTKEMIASVSSVKGKTLKNEANFNNEIGLPLTLMRLDETHEIAVVEMGMRGFDQISYLCKIAKPDIGVITNIDYSHIELTGSLDNTARAKGELLDFIAEDGFAILNRDCKYFDYFCSRARCNIISFGLSDNADVYVLKSSVDENGCDVCASICGEIVDYHITAVGEHNIINSLAAAACGKALGLSSKEIKRGLESSKGAEGRFLIKKAGDIKIIDDTYNASPISVISALKMLVKIDGLRHIAVLGDMLELGENAEELHSKVGEVIGECGVDILITVGELSRNMANTAAAELDNVISVATSDNAAELVCDIVRPGDVVLAKGSHSMHMERIVEALENVP